MSANSVRRAPETNTDPVFPDQDPNAPNIQTAQTREVAENTPAGRNLGARVAATDPGDVLTYSLDDMGAMSFDINRATGQLITKVALNFEESPPGTATVTATDPFGADATSVVAITVTDVNEDPSVSGAASIDHEENGTVLEIDAEDNGANPAEYTATDEDGDDDAATGLTWALSGADASKFTFGDETAEMRTLAFKANPDYESPGDSGANNVYEVTVKVTDSEGNSDELDVTVKVTNVEEVGTVTLSTLQPRVGFPVTATLADPDNVTADSVSWQWYNGSVTINTALANNGLPAECAETTFANCAIKGAASDTYTPVADDVTDTLNAVALYTDGSPNEGDAKDGVVAPAANQVLADTRNKAPVFPDQDAEMDGDQTDQERSVLENVPAMGNAPATVLVREITPAVTATDFITANEGLPTVEILTYTLGGPDADSFTIDRGTGLLGTKVALDTETKDTYMVTVTATDPSGVQATITVTIKVTGVDEAPEIMRAPDANVAPEFAAATTSRTVAENTVAGEDIGNPVAADDANGDALTYALSGTDAASFDIDPDTGRMMTLAALDYETKASYSVTVAASDSGGLSDSIDVTVTVTNVDEEEPADPVGRYDKNKNGRIDKDELVDGVFDYNVEQTLSKDELVELIFSYEIG